MKGKNTFGRKYLTLELHPIHNINIRSCRTMQNAIRMPRENTLQSRILCPPKWSLKWKDGKSNVHLCMFSPNLSPMNPFSRKYWRMCVSRKEEGEAEWRRRGWGQGINIEGGRREFPGWCCRAVLVGGCESGLAGGRRETGRVSPGTTWIW